MLFFAISCLIFIIQLSTLVNTKNVATQKPTICHSFLSTSSVSPYEMTLTYNFARSTGTKTPKYEPNREYSILLMAPSDPNRAYKHFWMQAREEGSNTPIGRFKFDTRGFSLSSKYFMLETCHSSHDTFRNIDVVDGEVGGAVLATWVSPDYLPSEKVNFYFSVVADDDSWINVIGASLGSTNLERSTNSSFMYTQSVCFLAFTLFIITFIYLF